MNATKKLDKLIAENGGSYRDALNVTLAKMEALQREIRNAFADYRYAEGCSCCRNNEEHEIAANRIGKALRVPKYGDRSGYNFSKFRSKE